MKANSLNRQGITSDFRGARVLVVEDNAMNQEVAREFLEAEGIMVILADNGQEALEILARESFDLVFMDVQMPVMDGLEATRRIRAEEEGWTAGQADSRKEDIGQGPFRSQVSAPSPFPLPPSPRLPIIAMTAHALAQAREECLAAGMNDVLVKPIDRERLLNILRNWLPEATAGKSSNPKKAKYEVHPQGDSDRNPGNVHPTKDAVRTLQARLPGFDVRAGLAFANHQESLYRQMLETFQKEGEGWGRTLDRALIEGDRERMLHAAHTLKGLARMLGATELADAALAVERKAGAAEPVDEAVGRLMSALGTVVGILGAFKSFESSAEPDAADSRPPGPVNREAVANLLETLRQCLDSDMKQALEQARRLRDLLDGTDLADAAAALKKDIFNFETDSALARLEKLAAHIGKANLFSRSDLNS